MEAASARTPEGLRPDLAKRIDLAREVLRPAVARDNPEARIARAAYHLLTDAACELAEDVDG